MSKPEFAADLPSRIPEKKTAYGSKHQNCKTSKAVPDMLTSDLYAPKTEPPPEAPVDGTGAFYLSLIPNQGELFNIMRVYNILQH